MIVFTESGNEVHLRMLGRDALVADAASLLNFVEVTGDAGNPSRLILSRATVVALRRAALGYIKWIANHASSG